MVKVKDHHKVHFGNKAKIKCKKTNIFRLELFVFFRFPVIRQANVNRQLDLR